MSAAEFEGLLTQINANLDIWRSTRSDRISVLEAGGGAFSVLQLPNTHITTIDISEEQVAKNDYAHRKIVGDLHTYQFAENEFDLIVCFDVLEHLERPELVVQSFLHAVKPGGLIYIAAPYNRSVAGLIAKFTPHWFHVFCYRYLFGPNPTDPGKERIHEFVFPTYLKSAMNPFQLKRLLEAERMNVRFFRLYSRDKREHLYNVSRILGLGYDSVTWLGRMLSLGTARPDCTDYLLLVERPGSKLAEG
jgi:SAM-dependent methyltransferase